MSQQHGYEWEDGFLPTDSSVTRQKSEKSLTCPIFGTNYESSLYTQSAIIAACSLDSSVNKSPMKIALVFKRTTEEPTHANLCENEMVKADCLQDGLGW